MGDPFMLKRVNPFFLAFDDCARNFFVLSLEIGFLS